MNPPEPSMRHRDDLQGLRAVAVLLVVFGHAGIGFLKGGFVGVDVFFVLSGFFITGLLLRRAARDGRVALGDFYLRRARRILPAATLTLVATAVGAYLLLNYVRAQQIEWDAIWAAFFAANVHFAHVGTDYFASAQPPSPVLHFWTLAVEEQFYLVWPALLGVVLFGVRRRRRRGGRDAFDGSRRRLLLVVAVIAAASLAWSVYETGVSQTAAYFSTFTRVWELALGAGLAVAAAKIARLPDLVRSVAGWAGLAAIAAAAVLYSSDTAFPGYAALLPCLGAAAVIVAGIDRQPRNGAGRLLALVPMRYVGDRSYTLYLWHWPFLIIGAQYAGHDLTIAENLVLLAGAFALSVITYRWFENPIRRGHWPAPAAAILWPASITAVVVVCAVVLLRIDGKVSELAKITDAVELAQDPAAAQKRTEEDVKAAKEGRSLPRVVAAVKASQRGGAIPAGLTPPVAELLEDRYEYPSGCGAHDGDTSSEICRLGDKTATRTLIVFGDSQAQMWMPSILAMAKRDGWAVTPISKSGCTPLRWEGRQGDEECHAWYRWALKTAAGLKGDLTLLAGSYTGVGLGFADDAKGTIVRTMTMLSRSSPTVLVTDPPQQVEQPVDCLLARGANMGRCTRAWSDDDRHLYDDLIAVARSNGFPVIDTSGWFCFRHRCPMVVGHTAAYLDLSHVSRTYALELAEPFRAVLRQALRQDT